MARRVPAPDVGTAAGKFLSRPAAGGHRGPLLPRHRIWNLGYARSGNRRFGRYRETTHERGNRNAPCGAQHRRKIMKTLNAILVLAIMTLGACKKEELAPVVRPVRSVVVEKRQVGDPA